MVSTRRFTATFLIGACVAAVIAVYAEIGGRVHAELGDDSSQAYYNLLVDGFRHGQLSLLKEAPAGLAQLADPYDPTANAAYRGAMFSSDRVHDLSYYRGRLYLYFGATPALVLFWPAAALMGHHVSHPHATIFFCALGFLASALLVCALWHRYFSTAPTWLALIGVLATGFATSAPLVLQRPEVWEVAVSCGYAMTMLALLALWQALHAERKAMWLALASLAFGLALGARPSLLPGALVLLVPLWQAWATARGETDFGARFARLTLATLGPLAAVVLGLLTYNYFRFGKIFEFGQHYQLAGDRQDTIHHFGLGYLWLNLRLYFTAAASWSFTFPFFRTIEVPPLPAGHGDVDFPYGMLSNTPFVWFALAAPLSWRMQPENFRVILKPFVVAVALIFATSAFVMALFYGSCLRYELEFSPALVLLAVCGLFGLHAMARERAPWLRVVLPLGIAALVYSAAFTGLYGMIRRAELAGDYGQALLGENRNQEALNVLESAARIGPGQGDLHFALGAALVRAKRFDAGCTQVIEAVRLESAKRSHYLEVLAIELSQAASPEKLPDYLQRLGRAAPDVAIVPYYLGLAFMNQDRAVDARLAFEEAVRLDSKFADAHCRLGILQARSGNFSLAVEQLREAIRLDPKQIDAEIALGRIFVAMGRGAEARGHFETALRLEPGNAPALDGLRRLALPPMLSR